MADLGAAHVRRAIARSTLPTVPARQRHAMRMQAHPHNNRYATTAIATTCSQHIVCTARRSAEVPTSVVLKGSHDMAAALPARAVTPHKRA